MHAMWTDGTSIAAIRRLLAAAAAAPTMRKDRRLLGGPGMSQTKRYRQLMDGQC
jgi:hypothetical protein